MSNCNQDAQLLLGCLGGFICCIVAIMLVLKLLISLPGCCDCQPKLKVTAWQADIHSKQCISLVAQPETA